MINKGLSQYLWVIVGEKGRVSHYGSEGREFESLRAHQKSLRIQGSTWILFCFSVHLGVHQALDMLLIPTKSENRQDP